MGKKLSSDSAWEKFGKNDPYYGVCSDEIFKTKSLSPDSLDAFFDSGQTHINHVIDILIWLSKKPIAKFHSVLDFGCGTGRLLIPLAKVAQNAVGIDVSKSMLSEAESNIKKMAVKNIKLIQSNSMADLENIQFDLVHTYIVLQHIPVHAGYKIIQSLVQAIKPGGVGMIHFPYRNDKGIIQNLGRRIKSKYPFISNFSNLLKGRPTSQPFMQMNNYDLKKILKILEDKNIGSYYAEFTNHGGAHGVCLYIAKQNA